MTREQVRETRLAEAMRGEVTVKPGAGVPKNPYPTQQPGTTLGNRESVQAAGHRKRSEVVLMTATAARPERPAPIKPITPASSLRTV